MQNPYEELLLEQLRGWDREIKARIDYMQVMGQSGLYSEALLQKIF